MKKISLVLSCLAGIGFLLAFLYVAVVSVAFAVRAYPQTPPFDAMARELVEYLTGRLPALSDLFTERESLHMVDVLALFRGARRIALVAAALGAVLLALCFWLGGAKRTGKGIWMGMGAFLGLALCLGIWAAMDFNGWFTVMHEMVFTNDLWLLDPAESMLIRMLPLDFFIQAVTKVVLRFGCLALCLALLAGTLQIPHNKRKQTS